MSERAAMRRGSGSLSLLVDTLPDERSLHAHESRKVQGLPVVMVTPPR
jgi:hypothetical protein